MKLLKRVLLGILILFITLIIVVAGSFCRSGLWFRQVNQKFVLIRVIRG